MRKSILLSFASFICLLVFAASSEWSLAKNKNGIKVYTRTSSGTKIKEFKAFTIMDASVSKIEKELKDVANHKDWIKDVLNPKKLKSISENEYYAYYELKIPFPFDNRDMILHVTSKKVNGIVTITQKSAPKYIAVKKGKVRMPISKGKWILTPMKDGKTKVFYQFLGDPAGSIPAWITNMFVVDGPYTSLTNLKKRVE